MTDPKFYGAGFPYKKFKPKDMPGKLIVLEGTDGVGRSTQIQMLRTWLENRRFCCFRYRVKTLTPNPARFGCSQIG